MNLTTFIQQPWPWYISGPLIGLVVPALLLGGNKAFGVSSSLKHICAACLPAKIPLFQYNWKAESWSLWFVTGIVFGGFIATYFLSLHGPVNISEHTVQALKAEGITDFSGLLPKDIFSPANIFTVKGLLFFVAGGFLVGFGTRYTDGCTSGHSIMGISSLQWPSLVATCCFMVGGIVSSWLLIPYLLSV